MRKITLFILTLCLILSLAACGQSAPEAPAFDLDQYKADIDESRSLISDASRDLASLASYELQFGTMLNKMDETSLEHGLELFEIHGGGTLEDVKETYSTIREQYKSIVVVDEEGNEAKEIRDAYIAMYEAYSEAYSLIISPDGTPTDFGNETVKYLEAVFKADDTLSLFLD